MNNTETPTQNHPKRQMEPRPRSFRERIRAWWTRQRATPVTPSCSPMRPACAPARDWRTLERFIITDDDFREAAVRRDKGAYDCLTQCLMATTLTRLGYCVEDCGYTMITVNGVIREASNSGQLVRDFTAREDVSRFLPFVVEMDEGFYPLNSEAPSVEPQLSKSANGSE